MNFQIIKRILGWILMFEALFLMVPVVTALIFGESDGKIDMNKYEWLGD